MLLVVTIQSCAGIFETMLQIILYLIFSKLISSLPLSLLPADDRDLLSILKLKRGEF
jgi:hypothetical protein